MHAPIIAHNAQIGRAERILGHIASWSKSSTIASSFSRFFFYSRKIQDFKLSPNYYCIKESSAMELHTSRKTNKELKKTKKTDDTVICNFQSDQYRFSNIISCFP